MPVGVSDRQPGGGRAGKPDLRQKRLAGIRDTQRVACVPKTKNNPATGTVARQGRTAALNPCFNGELLQLQAATQLLDLAVPPGNRLEALKGGRAGQYSIRINNQWRICFRWESGAHEVEIVDYH